MIKYISDSTPKNKRVLLRVDFNVSLNENYTISNDARITQSLPTIKLLLKNNNTLILISHLGRPKTHDPKLSLKKVALRLASYLPDYKVSLIHDFLTDTSQLEKRTEKQIFMLENIRFYEGEKKNDSEFAKHLAALGDVFVNDAFGVCHREDASVVGLAKLLPSYAGLLLKKEINMITKIIEDPKKPFVAIIGGAKISTKIALLQKLTVLADTIILGGGLANTFLKAEGLPIGKSLCEAEKIADAKTLLALMKKRHVQLVLPSDVVVEEKQHPNNGGLVKKIEQVTSSDTIYDIGPETQAKIGIVINDANSIIWNGPVGYFENPSFQRGTDFIYYSIAHNDHATSIVGGGDTLAAISKKEYLDQITHISTGGGAMLSFIENGTLPGIDALS